MEEQPNASDAPGEVEHDALAELERIHQAQKFNADDDGGYDPSYGISAPSLSYEPVHAPDDDPVIAPSRELKTLEDLYDAYPKIGDGQFYLRVVRKHPSTYNGMRVAGFLEDVYSRMSMSEFANRFGGHTYEVSVRGPARTTAIDADGRVQMRTLRSIRVEIPGSPIQLGPPNGENDMSMGSMPFRDSPQVKIKEMEIAADEQRRREAREAQWQKEVSSRTAISPQLLQAIETAAEKRATEVKDVASGTISELRERIRRDYEVIQTKDASIQALREKIVALQTDYATKLREEETRQVRELKDRHESELRRIKDDHSVTIIRMTEEHKRLSTESNERSTRERENIQKQEKIERDRMREDSTRRERQLIEDARMREENMRQNYESRLHELQRSLEREVRSVKEQRDREVLSVQATESTKSTLSEKTAKIQIDTVRSEMQRLHVELDSLRRENEHLRLQSHKTPEEAIEQAHRLASITGFGGGSKEPEELDWKRGVVSAVKGLIEKAPEIAEGLGRARETNRTAAAKAQHQARAAQQRAQQMARERQAIGPPPGLQQMAPMMPTPMSHAPPQPRRVPRPAPPGVGGPPTWDAGPPTPYSGDDLPPGLQGPPPEHDEEIPHHFGSPAPAQPVSTPLQHRSPRPLSPTDFGVPEPPDRAPVAPTPALEQASSVDIQPGVPPDEVMTAPAGVEITEEMVGKFAEKLDLAIASGLVTPKTFAQGFLDETGPEVAARILGSIGPDQLVDAVQAQEASAGTAIVTRDGRKYVQELWKEAEKLLASAGELDTSVA